MCKRRGKIERDKVKSYVSLECRFKIWFYAFKVLAEEDESNIYIAEHTHMHIFN
jgi:hypothetical protein